MRVGWNGTKSLTGCRCRSFPLDTQTQLWAKMTVLGKRAMRNGMWNADQTPFDGRVMARLCGILPPRSPTVTRSPSFKGRFPFLSRTPDDTKCCPAAWKNRADSKVRATDNLRTRQGGMYC